MKIPDRFENRVWNWCFSRPRCSLTFSNTLAFAQLGCFEAVLNPVWTLKTQTKTLQKQFEIKGFSSSVISFRSQPSQSPWWGYTTAVTSHFRQTENGLCRSGLGSLHSLTHWLAHTHTHTHTGSVLQAVTCQDSSCGSETLQFTQLIIFHSRNNPIRHTWRPFRRKLHTFKPFILMQHIEKCNCMGWWVSLFFASIHTTVFKTTFIRLVMYKC